MGDPLKKPLILAHRGSKGEAPENTLAAFKLAVTQESDGVELDVRLTKDNELIVIHDATIDRTSDGTGKVREMTLEEVQQFDAGSWFDEKFAGEKIPLLSEVLDVLPSHYLINIEVKDDYDGAIDEPLLAFIQDQGDYDRFVVSSFDHKSVKRLKLAEPKLKIGLLYSNNIIDPVGYSKLAGVDVFSIHPLARLITAEEVLQAEAAGKPIYTYTINEEAAMKDAIEKRIDGIITDYPARLKQVVRG